MNEQIDFDARDRQEVHLLERCRCGQDYIADLHIRHECYDCTMKRLYPPDGIKPEPLSAKVRKLWRRVVDAVLFRCRVCHTPLVSREFNIYPPPLGTMGLVCPKCEKEQR